MTVEGRTRASVFKWQGRFVVNVGKNFLTARTVQQWNRLLQKVIDPPLVEVVIATPPGPPIPGGRDGCKKCFAEKSAVQKQGTSASSAQGLGQMWRLNMLCGTAPSWAQSPWRDVLHISSQASQKYVGALFVHPMCMHVWWMWVHFMCF